ncbi:MAG: hypothetical protein VX976_01635, partial [Pseudomonadota bacterium]|nr:hypothetical protein [Pseudomonadota bacterium]
VNRILETVSDNETSKKKYKVKKLKTISGNLHAVIEDLDEKNSEILVALSVLEDKSKFKIL